MFCCMFASKGLPCDCWARENEDVLDTITTDNAAMYEAFWNIVSASYNEQEYAEMIQRAKRIVTFYEDDAA